MLKGTAVSGLAATLLLAGCGGAATPPASVSASASAPASTSAPSTFNVGGRLDLSMLMVGTKPGTACMGKGGYDDVVGGAQVKILDAAGAVIAFGTLNSGMSVQLFDASTVSSSHCRFTFSIFGVPAKGDIYGVEVARRGVVQFQKSDAEKLQLTLG